METQTQTLTLGVHHVALTVKDLQTTVNFFVGAASILPAGAS